MRNPLKNPTRTLLLLAACFALVAGAATYKWVDKDGKVHYSDKPVAGAEKVDLKPITEIPSIEVPQEDSSAPVSNPEESVAYIAIAIVSPKDGDTLRGSGIGLTLVAESEPPVAGGDHFEFEMDGAIVPSHIPYIERGTHTVKARILGANGNFKLESAAITFQVFQDVAKPPVTNTPKPTPKKPPSP